jgi:8-oxo-dGTP pyrophosphatase MutT (NUDIX family)
MITEIKPNDFDPIFEVVSCFCECNGEILLLKRQGHKPQGNTWGVPAGKMEKGENALKAITREVREECGIEREASGIHFFGTVYVRYAEVDFVYHIFHTTFDVKPEIRISADEHLTYIWISPNRALELDLIEDLDACIKLYYASP